jgi:XRE family transcriptional regulator, regulator of sulfur utilization
VSAAASGRWIEIGSRIREVRNQAGLSQKALAVKVGTSRRHIIRLERGDHRPTRSMLTRIAKATGQEPSAIDPEADEEARDRRR